MFNVPSACHWTVIVEIPDRHGHVDEPPQAALTLNTGLWKELPVIACVGEQQHPSNLFDLDQDTSGDMVAVRDVCKYLSALEDGTIDELYSGGGGVPSSKEIVCVIDQSSSMGSICRGHVEDLENAVTRLQVCKDSLRGEVLGRLTEQDHISLVAFDHEINPVADTPLASWEDDGHRQRVFDALDAIEPRGATRMYKALRHALQRLRSSPTGSRSKWLVALTDGDSHDSNSEVHDEVESLLRDAEGLNIRVLFITVGLDPSDEEDQEIVQRIRDTIEREEGVDQLFSAEASAEALEEAWQKVGSVLVSEKIEAKDLTDEECHRLLHKAMGLHSSETSADPLAEAVQRSTHGERREWSMLKQAYYVRYLQRRCHILRSSDKFNRNESFQQFGSSTMSIMIEEAHHALSDDYRHDWGAINHEQFVYWQEDGDSKWSLIATKPNALTEERLNLLNSLDLHVPTADELRDPKRQVLDAYLARGLGIELQNGNLETLDAEGFVLTLDFMMKMLCMNERMVRRERINCLLPLCITSDSLTL